MKQTLLKGMIFMFFFVLPFMIFAQGEVVGNVTDSQNIPLPGVTIVEKERKEHQTVWLQILMEIILFLLQISLQH